MKIGDRVRLTAHCASTFTNHGKYRIDWHTRQGIIETITAMNQIGVRWPGRASLDFWPEQALEILRDRPLDTKAPASHVAGDTAASFVGRDSPDGD